jgi:hypothetical protein
MDDVGISPNNILDYLGVATRYLPIVVRGRIPTETDIIYKLATLWYIGANPTSGNEGDLYYLAKKVSGESHWTKLAYAGGTGAIDTLTGEDAVPVAPDGVGNLDLVAEAVAQAGVPATFDGATANTQTLQIQVAADVPAATATKVAAGLAQFDDAYFTVDANGLVTPTGGGGWATVEVTTTSDDLEKSTTFIANNGSLVTLTLPATCAVGDSMRIVGQGAGGWIIDQNADQLIHFGATDTTTTTGTLASTNRYDYVELICTVTDTEFVAMSPKTLTVV